MGIGTILSYQIKCPGMDKYKGKWPYNVQKLNVCLKFMKEEEKSHKFVLTLIIYIYNYTRGELT